MKYLRFIIVGLAFVFLIYIIFIVYQNRTKDDSQNPQINQEQTSKGQWETKTDEQSPVVIKITPLEFGKDALIWKFDVAFDTHSGSLDDDVLAVATLVDDNGNIYKPTLWDGPGPGGHHREGILIFNSTQSMSEYIELWIKNVGGINERSFRWELE